MGIAVIIVFIALFMLGFPVAAAILVPCVGYILLEGLLLEMVAQRMQYALDSYTLAAVPLFILVGNLMNSSGITTRMFNFADKAVGRFPGGLAQVNIFASLVFSGMSGTALADIGGLGQVEIKAMKEKGFSVPFSAGVSVIKLLLSDIVPAILAVIAMMLLTAFLAIVRKYPRAERWPSLGELWASFYPAFPALLTPVLLIVGMLTGVFTPTEASSITVFWVSIISILNVLLLICGMILDSTTSILCWSPSSFPRS